MKKPQIIIAMIVLLIGTVLVGIAYRNIARGQKADRFREEIERLESELNNTGLSAEGHKAIEQELESVKIEATHRAAAYLKWTQISSGSITPIQTERYILVTEDAKYRSRLPDGISDKPVVRKPLPRYDESSTIISSWRKTTPKRYYLVYAGYITTDTEQGMVLVFQDPKIDYHQYLTPRKSGAVKIVAENNFYLALQAEYEDIFYFDVVGERFVDLQEEPTVTSPAKKEVFIPTQQRAYSIKIPDGIDNDPFIPLPIFGYDKHTKVLNSWKKTAEERYFLVYAGYMTDDQKQGMVLIQTNDSIFFRRYLTPKRSGPVRIVAEHDLYLTLQAENGDTFYFDPVGERFIDSLDAPTVTPTPSEQIEAGTPEPPYPAP